MSWIGNKEYIDCPECPCCCPQEGLQNGARYGICHGTGNTVYLEPWKEKRISGSGWIHHPVSSCALYEKNDEAALRRCKSYL